MSTNEFEQMKPLLEHAGLGSYLIIPLKYDSHTINSDWIHQNCIYQDVTTMDLNESVKLLFNKNTAVRTGTFYEIPSSYLLQEIYGTGIDPDAVSLAVTEKSADPLTIDWTENQFQIHSLHLTVFHTETAFLSVGICFRKMETLRQIRNPGYADRNSKYYFQTRDGSAHEFSLDEALTSVLEKAGLQAFFQSGTSLFLEAYTYNVAVISERFKEMETMRQITFNQHRLTSLTLSVVDNSEADVHFVYAVRDQSLATYRWGCCVSSQTISYIVADKNMDINAEMETQAEDGLPLVLLALYEKYTCLHFTELLSSINKRKMRRLRTLKKKMLEFKAFGTVHPANISRWHNVKMIYEYLLTTNGISEAIEDIDDKINILNEHQNEIETHRNDTVMSLITIFGIVSILASVLSIIQILNTGNTLEWIVTILTTITIVMISWIVYLWDRRN